MEKIIAVGIVLLLTFSMFFGCTQPDANDGTKITNDADAIETISDAGSDISGVTETLNDIDTDLTA